MLEDFSNTCINQIINDTEWPQSFSLRSPEKLLDMEYDQSVPEGKPTSSHAQLENDLITTNVVSDETASQ